MKLNIVKYIAFSLAGAGLLASCINKYEDEPLPDIPQVAFLESQYPSTMNKTTGEILEIKPVIIGGSNLRFEWKSGEEVISETADLTYELTEPGELILDFTAKNDFGEVTKRFTVNVVEFRRPYMDAHNTAFMLFPYGNLICRRKAVKSSAFPQYDPIIFRHRSGKPISTILMPVHIWICPLNNKWFIIICFSVSFLIHDHTLFHLQSRRYVSSFYNVSRSKIL